MSDKKYVHFKEICQGQGLKATNQRFVIYKTLVTSHDHPTADLLFERVAPDLPGLSRDTVYRTLNMLASKKVVQKVVSPGGATHFDGDTSPHHHFLCETCGHIYDFTWPDFEMLDWPEDLGRLGRPGRASVLVLGAGRCCLADRAESGAPRGA